MNVVDSQRITRPRRSRLLFGLALLVVGLATGWLLGRWANSTPNAHSRSNSLVKTIAVVSSEDRSPSISEKAEYERLLAQVLEYELRRSNAEDQRTGRASPKTLFLQRELTNYRQGNSAALKEIATLLYAPPAASTGFEPAGLSFERPPRDPPIDPNDPGGTRQDLPIDRHGQSGSRVVPAATESKAPSSGVSDK